MELTYKSDMTELITHTSVQKKVTNIPTLLERSEIEGVICKWHGNRVYSGSTEKYQEINFSWIFDWNNLKSTGVEGLSGHIEVITLHGCMRTLSFDIDMTDSLYCIERTLSWGDFDNSTYVMFEYSLIPYRSSIEILAPIEDVFYDELFQSSEKNDAILVIEGKKLHVNKEFLSCHSDFFQALFSSNFKEGQMDEIPIEDVSYEDFTLLMSIMESQQPNDETAEKLLELADRFMIPSVTRHVEHHLLNNSSIKIKKKTWMADAYSMPELLEKCLRDLNTLDKVQRFKATPEYKKLSNDTKSTVLEIHINLV